LNILFKKVNPVYTTNKKKTENKQIITRKAQFENKSISSAQSLAIKSNILGSISFKAKKMSLDKLTQTVYQRTKATQPPIQQKIEKIQVAIDKIIEEDKSRRKPVISNFNKDFIRRIAEDIATNPKKIRTFAMYGVPGGGNTFVTRMLNYEMPDNKQCTILTGHDFGADISRIRKNYFNPSEMYVKNPKINVYKPEYYNINGIETTIKQLISGKDVSVPMHYINFYCRPSRKRKIINHPGDGGVIILDFPLPGVLEKKPDVTVHTICSDGSAKKRWFDTATNEKKKGYTQEAANILYGHANYAINKYNDPNQVDFTIDAAALVKDRIKVLSDFCKILSGIY